MKRTLFWASALAVIALIAYLLWLLWPEPDIEDAAKKLGLTPEDFPELRADVFAGMDSGTTLSADAVAGRNSWNLWAAGSQGFIEWLATQGYGMSDTLRMLDSRKRFERFEDLGLNDAIRTAGSGTVPTLYDLLEPAERRPEVIYREYDVYDQRKVGFISEMPEENGRRFFRIDTRTRPGATPRERNEGNGNGGHEGRVTRVINGVTQVDLYGTDLPREEKDAIIEYLKTF